jgi:tRNA1(Val) A37 N6-methylase TrmN6
MSSLKTKADQSRSLGGGPDTTTLDDFLGGRISAIQPKAGHRAGSDAVWLQAAVPACAGERVLDAGAGVGVAALCLLSRCPQISVTAVDIDGEACALAEANAAGNDFSGQFRAMTADLTAPAESLFAKGLVREGYDQVIANPPFYAVGTVRAAQNAGRAAAHIMQEGALEAWIRSLVTFAAPKGWLTLIHRPEILPELLPLLDRRFGAVTLFPLFAREGDPARRIILQARKGGRAGLRLLGGQVMHRADGRYTDEAEAVLRQGKALELGD